MLRGSVWTVATPCKTTSRRLALQTNPQILIAQVKWLGRPLLQQRRRQSTSPATASHLQSPEPTSTITVDGQSYQTDTYTNVSSRILTLLPRRLHLQPHHPLSLTRALIESRFPHFTPINSLSPIVSVHQNFDSLQIPPDHPSRSKTDTYYLNRHHLLRTHTSAHELDTFAANATNAFLITADVYRRDAVDSTHYPVFHQTEGARLWDRDAAAAGDTLAQRIWGDVASLPRHDIIVEDPNPHSHPERNPRQPEHAPAEAEAVSAHLKRSLEGLVASIFTLARRTASTSPDEHHRHDEEEPLRVRWVEAYFPFTSPSWELEVHWRGEWLEVLGCGVTRHALLAAARTPRRVGWAFGLGLERLAMLLFGIPDIRLFWSGDERFLGQFRDGLTRFVPFSRYPGCYKDVSFWVPGGAEGERTTCHENDVAEVVRTHAGDLVEAVALTDEFVQPRTGRASRAYRINYRSLERTLTNREVNALHARICEELVGRLGVEIR